MRCGLLRAICALALLAALLPAAAIAADSGSRPAPAGFQALYDEYRNLGVILGCSHREADLRSALSAVPADIEAYDPGFVDALNAALEGRTSGCEDVLASPFAQPTASGTGAVIAGDGSPGPARPRLEQPLPAAATAAASMPAALLALAVIVGAALLAAAAFALARRRSWHPGRRH